MITVEIAIMELTGIPHINMVVAVGVAVTVVIVAAVIALVMGILAVTVAIVVIVVTVLMDVLIVQIVVARMEALVANKKCRIILGYMRFTTASYFIRN